MPAGDFPQHCAGCRCFEGRSFMLPAEAWQRCPVCEGRGWMPQGFFTGMHGGTSTKNDTCKPCNGTGLVRLPGVGNGADS